MNLVFLEDVRYAGRMLANNPGFTAAALTCLALGIGATTAIFSVVNAVVLKPLPYADSNRLVRIYTEFRRFHNGGLSRFPVSPPEFLDLRRDLNSFQAIEAWQVGGAALAGNNQPVRATEAYISGGMLQLLGVHPLLGRVLSASDDLPAAPLAAVLSYGLWQRAYGADPKVLGRDIRHDGNPCFVAGVMPQGFEFPPGENDPIELWVPLQLDPTRSNTRGSHRLNLLGRLRDGVPIHRARAEIERMVKISGERAAPRTHSFNADDHTIFIAGFQDEVIRNVRLAMLVLLGAVFFVLLISCVNVANLLLARAESRRREIAIRKAVGASQTRMIGQFLVEGLLLSALGALTGLALAWAATSLVAGANGGSIPRASGITIDAAVLLFTVAVSAVSGAVFGMAPLLHLVGANLHGTLKDSSGRASGSAAANWFRSVLAMSEIALALILLIGTALMVQAFWKLQAVDTGLNTRNIATVRVTLPQGPYARTEKRVAFWSSLENRAAALPGVQRAAVAVFLPPVELLLANDTQIEGFIPKPGGPLENVDHYNSVGSKYFDLLGIRLLDGRFFDARDGAASPEVVIVNRTMARTYWPNRSAIGRRVKPSRAGNWRTVAGVVADVKNSALDRPAGAELYFPEPQGSAFGGDTTMTLLVRGAGNLDSMRLVPSILSSIRELEPSAAVSAVRSMDDVVGAARSRPRFLALLMTIFSAVALVLASLGIYGVVAYSVAQRTREIGIRMAMGARPADVLGLVLRGGLSVALPGTLAGAAGALALTRVLRGLLFEVSAFDVPAFVLMALAMIAIALLASFVPARRAARLDPMAALRYE